MPDAGIGDEFQGVLQVMDGFATFPLGALAVKPNEAVAPGARVEFQPTGLTVTTSPLVLGLPFQRAAIDWPEFMVMTTVQELTALLPAVMVTCPLKPLFHCEVRA